MHLKKCFELMKNYVNETTCKYGIIALKIFDEEDKYYTQFLL